MGDCAQGQVPGDAAGVGGEWVVEEDEVVWGRHVKSLLDGVIRINVAMSNLQDGDMHDGARM